jgi:hypothetical protein
MAWASLGLAEYEPDSSLTLPVLMATDQPEPERWRKKRPYLEDIVSLT